MTRIIYIVYIKEYLTSRQIIGANLKKYAFLCDYSEVKIDDLIDSPMSGKWSQSYDTGYGRRWHRYERPHDTTNKGGNNSMIETMLMMQMMGNNQMSFPFMPNQSQKEEK